MQSIEELERCGERHGTTPVKFLKETGVPDNLPLHSSTPTTLAQFQILA